MVNDNSTFRKPGQKDWGDYSLNRQPGKGALRFFHQDEEVESESESDLPAIRDRVFNENLRNVATRVISHEPGVSQKIPEEDLLEASELIHTKVAIQGEISGEEKTENDGGTIVNEALEILEFSSRELEESEIPDPENLWVRIPPPIDAGIYDALIHLSHVERAIPADFIPLNKHLLDINGAGALGWVLYDPYSFAARTYLDRGFDSYTRSNLYLGPSEDMTQDIIRSRYFVMEEVIASQMQFRKRFSSFFIHHYHGMELIDLSQFNMRGYLTLFYREAPEKMSPEKEAVLHGAIRDMLPFVNAYKRRSDIEQYRTDMTGNSFRRLYSILKGALKASRSRLNISYLVCDGLGSHSAWKLIQQQASLMLLGSLHEGERVIIIAPGILLAILTGSQKEEMGAITHRINGNLGTKFELHYISYPELGFNIMNYIYPGAIS